MGYHSRDWGVKERIVIQSILNNEFDSLTGIEIAKKLNQARIEDTDNAYPSSSEKLELHLRRIEIKSLRNHVARISIYQFRVDGFLDIYPKGGKYFNVPKKEWGSYPVGQLQEFIDFIKEQGC